MNINGIIISAGFSKRMDNFKPLAIFKNNTFIQNIVLKLNTICDQIIIVTGHKSDELKDEIIKNLIKDKHTSITKKIVFVFNRSFAKGMFGSIQCGISKMKSCEWLLLHQVDQPGLPRKFYIDFISQIDKGYNWMQPSFKKKSGHPILIHKSLYGLIATESVESNLRIVSKKKKIIKKIWDCNYKDILQDIDTEKDYQKLMQKEY